jgi:hypothetical protein
MKRPKRPHRGLVAPATRFELASPFGRQLSRAQGGTVGHGQAIDWPKFEEWLNSQYSPKHAKQLYSRAAIHHEAASDPMKAAQLKVLSRDKRRLIMEGLAAYSKFTGTYETWQGVRKQAGLKWEQSDPLNVVTALLDGEATGAIDWLKETVTQLPAAHRTVLIVAALTGLRPDEAAKACQLVYDLAQNGQLADYYDAELNLLQHFKYPKLFLRRTKNAYISFVSPRVIQAMAGNAPVTYEKVSQSIRTWRKDVQVRTKELRKYHATLLRKHLEREIVDLLQGRVGTSIFAKHYYRPLLAELRDRVLAATKPLEDELVSLLALAATRAYPASHQSTN